MSDAQEKKWRLSGKAHGRFYDEDLEFIGKRKDRVPTDVLEGHLENVRKVMAMHGKTTVGVKGKELSEEEYLKLVEEVERAEFKTNKGVVVLVQPRYAGSVLGSDDDRGNTICALFVANEYVAPAFYRETEKEIIAHEY